MYYNTLIVALIDTSLTIWLSLNTNTYWNMLKWRDFIYYIHADLEIFSPNFCHQNKMISILKISDTQKHQNFVMTATKYCNISIQTIYKTIFLKNFDLHFPLCVQFILKAERRRAKLYCWYPKNLALGFCLSPTYASFLQWLYSKH